MDITAGMTHTHVDCDDSLWISRIGRRVVVSGSLVPESRGRTRVSAPTEFGRLSMWTSGTMLRFDVIAVSLEAYASQQMLWRLLTALVQRRQAARFGVSSTRATLASSL